MKKFVKTVLITTLVVVFGGMLICCFPITQRLIVTGVLSHYFDDVMVPKVCFGFSGIRAKNVCMRYDDLTIRFANLDVKWHLKDWFSQKIFNVESATLDGLMLSVENEPKDVLYFEKKKVRITSDLNLDRLFGEFPKQTSCISALCQLPISVGKLSVNGSFDMYEKILGDFSLDVANFARAKTADVDFTFNYDFVGQIAGKFKIFGHTSVSRDIFGEINSIALNSSISSKNGSMKNGKAFLLDVTYNRNAAAHDIFQVTFVDEQSLDEILDASCNFDENSKNVSFKVDLKISAPMAKYFVFNSNLSPFSCRLYSTGEYNVAKSSGLVKSSLDATFSRNFFSKILPKLKDDLKLKLNFALGIAGETIEIQSISGELGDVNNEQVVCSMELADKHRFQWPQNSLLKNLNGLAVNVNVDSVDASIFGAIRDNWHLHSTISGKCILTFKNSQLHLFGDVDKFNLSNLWLAYGGNKVLDGFRCSFEPRIVVSDVAKCDIVGLTCTDSRGANVLQGDLGFTVSKKFCSCSGNLLCDLANFLKQPFFKNELKLSSGLASCNFSLVQKGRTCDGDAELRLKAITYNGSKSPLNGNLNINLASVPSIENEVKFNITGNLHDTMDSDVLISGIMSSTKEETDNNIRTDVKSSAICLTDVITLCKLFAIRELIGNSVQEKFFARRISTPDDVPVWDEILLDASLQIDALYLNDVQLCSDLSCTLKIDPKLISLPNIVCSVLDAPFLSSCSLVFTNDDDGGMYSLKVYFSLSDLGASKCMLLLNYNPKIFTGTFGAKGSFSASRAFLSDLLPHLQGKVDIVGTNGNISPMALFGNEQKEVVGLIGVTGSLLNINIANDLIRAFGNIPYDKLSTAVIRQSNGDVILDSFVLTGENIRVTANGTLTARAGLSFCDYGMRLESQISTKNSMTEIFDTLGWSTNMFDYYGYKMGPKINIKGTVGNPDLGEIRALLGSAGMRVLSEQGGNNSGNSIISPETLLKMFQK